MADKLYRSTSDSMLGGVCGGLGRYFNVDANLIRLIFVVLAVLPGFGVPIYLVLWLILPEDTEGAKQPLADRVRDGTDQMVERAKQFGQEVRATATSSNPGATCIIGFVLVALGAVFLLRNLGITWLSWIAFGTLWPALLILVGVAFLWRWFRGR